MGMTPSKGGKGGVGGGWLALQCVKAEAAGVHDPHNLRVQFVSRLLT